MFWRSASARFLALTPEPPDDRYTGLPRGRLRRDPPRRHDGPEAGSGGAARAEILPVGRPPVSGPPAGGRAAGVGRRDLAQPGPGVPPAGVPRAGAAARLPG